MSRGMNQGTAWVLAFFLSAFFFGSGLFLIMKFSPNRQAMSADEIGQMLGPGRSYLNKKNDSDDGEQILKAEDFED